MKKQFVVWMFLLLMGVCVPSMASTQVSVVTSIRPLALIAAEVLAPVPGAKVDIIVPKNASPHGFSLKPSHLTSLLSAPALLWLGPSFEPYLEKAIAKRSTQNGVITIERLDGIQLLDARLAGDGHTKDPHVEDSAHDHHHYGAGYDPHVWWSSENALVIATAVAEKLAADFPAHQPAIEEGLLTFKTRMQAHREAFNLTPKSSRVSFVVYHDSLVYLEKELARFSSRRVTFSPETKPSIKDILAVKLMMKRNQLRCIIMEPNADQKFLQKIKPSEAVRVVSIDPLGWEAENYSSMWHRAATTLVECSQDP